MVCYIAKGLFTVFILLRFVELGQATHLTYPRLCSNESAFDDHFGIKVVSPYKWISTANEEVRNNIYDVQLNLTNSFICTLRPSTRKRIEENVRQFALPRVCYSPETIAGDHYFWRNFLVNEVLVQTGVKSKPRVLSSLPQNQKASKKSLKMRSYFPSPNGELVAFVSCKLGNSFYELSIKDTKTGKELKDALSHIAPVQVGVIYWTRDASGIYYKGAKANSTRLFYHALDSDQNEDILITDLSLHMHSKVSCTEDGTFLVISSGTKIETGNIYYTKVRATKSSSCQPEPEMPHKLKKLEISSTPSTLIGSVGSVLYLHIEHSGIIKCDLLYPEKKNWEFFLKYSKDSQMYPSGILDRRFLVVTVNEDIVPFRKLALYQLSNASAPPIVPIRKTYIWDLSIPRSGMKFSFRTCGYLGHCETRVVDFSDFPLFDVEVIPKPGEKQSSSALIHRLVTTFNYMGKTLPIVIEQKKHIKPPTRMPTILVLSDTFPWFVTMRRVFMPFVHYFEGRVAFIKINDTRFLPEDSLPDTLPLHSTIAAIDYLVKKQYINASHLILMTCFGRASSLGAILLNKKPEMFKAVLLFDVQPWLHANRTAVTASSKIKYDYAPYFTNSSTARELLKISPIHNIRPPTNSKTQYPAVLVIDSGTEDSLRFLATLQKTIGRSRFQKSPILAKFPVKTSTVGTSWFDAESESIVEILSFLALSLESKSSK